MSTSASVPVPIDELKAEQGGLYWAEVGDAYCFTTRRAYRPKRTERDLECQKNMYYFLTHENDRRINPG
jgi:hypothetical protein